MDRRISIVTGLDENETRSVQTLSNLAAYPKVVLLGEPGSGKTTALNFMAAQEQASVISVRELINDPPANANNGLFLDALDEYRSDGSETDKIFTLAKLIREKSPDRWRLTCRAEDWRNKADTARLEKGSTQSIVVAQLLPLDYAEACKVLNSLREKNPDAFMEQAGNLGAHAFTESPLSLKLLHKAVSANRNWPATRFELFTRAITKLAHEHNQEYQADYERSSPEKIIAAAGKIALLQLLSGARAIWRSQGPTPDNMDQRAFITMHHLQLETKLLRDSLDTALFRGEGESFEFMHRTIAEFLAGQALARAVSANGPQARFPLHRALALLTGSNHKPPTGLRGVFAWFAAHLAQQNDHTGAQQLAEIDACSLLTYGDAAAFNTETRKTLLHNLDRDDPYFRSQEQGITVLGGLLDETLIDDVIEILQNPPEASHLLLTVAQSLASGRPISALQPHLRRFVLNQNHSDWQRKWVLDAFSHGSQNPASDLRELFEELANESPSIAREGLRIEIAHKLHPAHLTATDLKILLADFERTPGDNTIGQLCWLEMALAKNPCLALFDEPCSTWRPPPSAYRSHEVDSVLDSALAGCIRYGNQVTGKKIWKWVVNSREYFWSCDTNKKETQSAIAEWLKADKSRESELLEEILATLDNEIGHFGADQIYHQLSGQPPSESTLRRLLKKVRSGNAENIAPSLLAIFLKKARQVESDPALFWEIYELLEERPECSNLLQHLTTSDTEYGRPSALRDQTRNAEVQRRKNERIEKLTTLIPEINTGKHINILGNYARLYFQGADFRKPSPRGFERVVADTNQEIAEAISFGWEYWTKTGIQDFDIPKLSSACNSIYDAEYAAIAGLAQLVEKHAQAEIPESAIQSLTLAALRCSPCIHNDHARKRIEDWVASQLANQPEQGIELLTAFWQASLETKDPTLSGMDALTRQPSAAAVLSAALSCLLREHENLSADTLRPMLLAGSKVLGKEQIEELCSAALGNESIADDVRQQWQLLRFLNAPSSHQPPLPETIDAAQVNNVLNQLEHFERPSSDEPAENHREIARFIIELAGPLSTPDREGSRNLSHEVHGAINRLSSDPDQEATMVLRTLIENPKLQAWEASLRHALSEQKRLRSDQEFTHPSIQSIHEALAGGPPVNAADLFAIAIEELRRLQTELHTTNTTGWKEYWNRDQHGRATDALIENECRNHLLERLKDRLVPYQISAAMPEAQSAEGTRVDILMLSGAGANLPIEAKRHFHEAVWSAASSQLQGYATAAGADQYGIYLVFWFGSDYEQTPALPDKSEKPNSAKKMEQMLYEGLPEALRAFTKVVVFDVSRPAT